MYNSREVVKAQVFKPRMQGPTMTIEEYGEQQLQMMQEQQQNPNTSSDETKPIRRIQQLEADGDEDNIDLVDKVCTSIYLLFTCILVLSILT